VEFRAVEQIRLGEVLIRADRNGSRKASLPSTQALLLVLTAAGAVLSLIDTPYPALAPLQNLPTLAVTLLLWLALRHWPMPTSAVICVCLFLMLHTIGGRYIYSYVPYEAWLAALGLPSVDMALGLGRNSWDRLVHFSFGLLFVHPLSCWLIRHRGMAASLALYIAVEFVFAGSALYEVFEWLLTVFMAGPDADAYNGQQGDMWDAQKDMALAGTGAIVAALWLRLRAYFQLSSQV
jgi:putative membrane protein